MRNFGHCNELKRATQEQVAHCANRADWIVVIGAAIIVFILEVLPCATCS